METPTLITSLRSIKGKKVKRLRAKGRMPLHVYGFGIESLSLEAPYKEVMSILKEAGRTTPVVIKIDGEKDIVTLIREVGQNPISGTVEHVDFMKVDEDKPVVIKKGDPIFRLSFIYPDLNEEIILKEETDPEKIMKVDESYYEKQSTFREKDPLWKRRLFSKTNSKSKCPVGFLFK